MFDIIVIDNGSDTIDYYKSILGSYTYQIVSWKKISNIDLRKYRLIILSDGHDINVKNNVLLQEIVLNNNQPIIGICYGFQLIAYTYGCELVPLDEPRNGILDVSVTENCSFFDNISVFYAFKKHKFGIKKLSDSVNGLSISNDGYEIIKINDKDIYGFQYHPEIIIKGSTELSTKIFQNLVDLYLK